MIVEENIFSLSKINCVSRNKPIQWFIKRAVDIFGSLIGLIALFPLFIVVGIIIKLESKGPVLYKQKRIGQHGKEFYMYKFRSMVSNAESELEKLKKYNETNSCMFKMANDPRVTKFGRFIRKFSIDELPQLINVLQGDMSLVGFRPPIESELSGYENWHYVRFTGMPGLTGIWQVSGRSSITDFNKVVELEKEYITSWNLANDIKILFKTIPVVISGKDAA